jgi:hypothetical protein
MLSFPPIEWFQKSQSTTSLHCSSSASNQASHYLRTIDTTINTYLNVLIAHPSPTSYFAIYSMLIRAESCWRYLRHFCLGKIHSSQALDDSYVGGKGIQPQTASTGSFAFWCIFFSSTSYLSNGQHSVEPKQPISLSPPHKNQHILPHQPWHRPQRWCRRQKAANAAGT